MKKTCKLIIMLWMAFTLVFPSRVLAKEQTPEELSNLYAKYAVLMDADSGRVLFGKEEDVAAPMASTTKIMTCILALECADTDEAVSVSKEAVKQPKVKLGAMENESFQLEDLLYSLMLESHNDSAVMIAEHVAGTVEKFAEQMNAKARELGCTDTHFVTPNGLDGYDEEGVHSTTARDLARIMKYCIMDSPKREEFLRITQTKSYEFANAEGTRSFSCNNHNAFLGMMAGAISGKTGFTGDAGYCYVGALEQDGRTFIVALLACGWPNNKGYKWTDTKKLMSYGIENYQYRNVWKNISPNPIKVEAGIPDSGRISGLSSLKPIVKEEELKLLLKEQDQVSVKVNVLPEISAPVKKGKVIGVVQYYIREKMIAEYPVTAKVSVEKRTFGWCAGRLVRMFGL